MNNKFNSDETLYRAVIPSGIFWKSDGSLSSAALKDNKGLSVDRGDYRNDYDVAKEMKNRLNGIVVKFLVEDCTNIEARVIYEPNKDDAYHSLVLGKEKLSLSKSQARQLSRKCKIVYDGGY